MGWHLVFVTSVTPGRIPPYEEIEPQVKAAWLDEQRLAARQRAFEAMKAHYEVHLQEVPNMETAQGAPTAKSAHEGTCAVLVRCVARFLAIAGARESLRVSQAR